MTLEGGSTIDATRVVLERNRSVGVVAGNPESRATFTDLVIRDTRETARDGSEGGAAASQGGALLEVTRGALVRNRGVGLLVTEATARMTDAIVAEVAPREPSMAGGRGIVVQAAGVLDLVRTIVERTRDTGVLVTDEGSSATFADVLVRDSEESLIDGTGGQALQVQVGAHASGARVVAERSRTAGLVSAAGAVELTDARIADSLPARCTSPSCSGFGYGVVGVGGSVRLTRFALERATVCGVIVADDGGIDLDEGRVSESEIGACVQIDGYDLARLMRNVVYERNTTNLDATMLPVPQTLTALD
jgi:hypothetical protein